MKLLLARHGQTDWNIARRYQGQSDIPLNSVGICQAEGLAQRLTTETIHAIYSSDLARAMKTAQTIANSHQLEVNPDPRWRELSFGDWEGMGYQEISSHMHELFDAWMKDPAATSTPNGESLAQLAERVKNAVDEIKAKHKKDETILIISHSGALQTLLSLTLGMDLNRYWQFRFQPASLTVIQLYDDSAILELFNDRSHLKENE